MSGLARLPETVSPRLDVPTVVLVKAVVADGSRVTDTVPALTALDSSMPLAIEMVNTGIVTSAPPPKEKSGGSPGTLFQMITADAPAACAYWALIDAAQPPRLISATAPAGKPTKSAAKQPR